MMVSGVLMLHLIYGSFQTGTCGLSTSTVRGAKFVKVVHSNPPPPKNENRQYHVAPEEGRSIDQGSDTCID